MGGGGMPPPMYSNHPSTHMNMNAMYCQQNIPPMPPMATTNGTTTASGKKSVLKRKNTQTNGMNDNRPTKQQFMQQTNGMPNGTAIYQQQPSAMYNHSMSNGSPNFPSPSTPMQHLSPYGYDQQQNAQMYNKRPNVQTSSEQVRLELRHSVQARQNATSPNPSNAPMAAMQMMSPGEMGPRFAPPNGMTPVSPLQNGGTGNTTNPSPQYHQNGHGIVPSPMKAEFPDIPSMQAVSSVPLHGATLEDCKNYLTSTDIDLSASIVDFNLFNGQFDLSSDETLTLVQQMLS
jgi:hypothetical protein